MKKKRKFLSFDPSFSRPEDIDPQNLPKHVAIIMDGSGRWAKKRKLNRINGHNKGAETVREIVRTSRQIGIPYLTLYAFSTENWQRPSTEVNALMVLLKKFLRSEKQEMMDNNIRLHAIGEVERLPKNVQKSLQTIMELTKHNDGLMLNLALSYGSRSEIVKMVKAIAQKIKTGDLLPDEITSELVSAHLYTRGMPDPDLLIRTSGEQRISNFLLWQIAYAEIFVTDTLWPDFSKEEFLHIIKNYQQRDRRFGKVKA
jgi:undecaprenyl diphosphate synthase